MLKKVVQFCTQRKSRYGYRKITALLWIEGPINHKRIQPILQYKGLQCRVRMKKQKNTGQTAKPAEHLLKRKFHAKAPLQKLVTDITYLPFGN
ncbi:IS3 family transposase [Paenibacillus sp. LS1]|nr:IS3 family transposase [Paenibacillus sp. LS1]